MVDDDGPGIQPDALGKIFERFYTDRPEQGQVLPLPEQQAEVRAGQLRFGEVQQAGADPERDDVVGVAQRFRREAAGGDQALRIAAHLCDQLAEAHQAADAHGAGAGRRFPRAGNDVQFVALHQVRFLAVTK